MTHPDAHDRWYLRLLAGVLAVMCGICSIRYGWNAVAAGGVGASVPLLPQLLCVALTAAGVVYFVRPRWGHHAMLAATAVVLATQASAGPRDAVVFWLFVAAVLMIPYLPRRAIAPVTP